MKNGGKIWKLFQISEQNCGKVESYPQLGCTQFTYHNLFDVHGVFFIYIIVGSGRIKKKEIRKKNQKKTFLLIGIVAFVVVIGIVGFFTYKAMQPSPAKAWDAYVNLVKDKKYAQMYACLDTASQRSITKENFVKKNKNIYEGMDAKNIRMTITDTTAMDNGKKLFYKMSMNTIAGPLSFKDHVNVIKEDGSYKIQWKSSLILPDLGTTDHVSVQTLRAKRGSILDRNGNALAEQGAIYKVGLIAGSMKDESASIKSLAKALGMNEDTIKAALSASWVQKDMFVPVKTISASQKDTLKDTLKAMEGVSVQEGSGRIYPYGEMCAHLTGYVQLATADDLKKHKNEGYTENSYIGKSGLENTYEKDLRGNDGVDIAIYDAKGNVKKNVLEKAKQDGRDIKTTIDINVQKALYEQVKNDAGSALAMNSKTGEVLGMVSMPAFDPNSFAMGMDTKTWDSLANNKQNPLLDRITSTYAPGSTFKVVTGAIGLDTKTITPATTFAKTAKWQKDKSWGNNYVTTTEAYSAPSNLENAYIYSDNIFFAQLADKIGTKNFTSYLDKIGFNKSMNFPLHVSESTYGSQMKDDQMLAASGYGQGDILVSPLHLTALYTAYVNDGSIMQPYLLYDNAKPSIMVKNAYTSTTAKTIMNDLVATMNTYSGGNPTNSGGKSGTAQVNHGQQEIGWMVGINDKYAVTVMIDNTKDNGESHYVIPKVKSILNELK